MTSFLLTTSVSERSSTQLQREYCLSHLGGLLDYNLTSDELKYIEKKVSGSQSFTEWQKAVAEELLLRKICGQIDHPDAVSPFLDVSLFETETKSQKKKITLQDCWNRNCAVAVFPLASKDDVSSPGIGHVWIVEGLAHREKLDGVELIPEHYGVCKVSTSGFTGKSWQLAGAMALKALEENKPDYKRKLATEWIITGCVEKKLIKRVELGNKLDLKVGNRRWLIPMESTNQVAPIYEEKLSIRTTDLLNVAWNHISGTGSKSQVSQEWPKMVKELHILVGGNIKAQIASILLTECEVIVLWHSDDEKFSKEPAQQIVEVLDSLKHPVKPLLRKISDSSIVDAEREIKGYFEKVGVNSSTKVLFNITSGNRLMSYAVQSLARLYSTNIDLIYREQGCKKEHQFTLLNYREFPPYSGAIRGCGNHKVDWGFLYSGDRYDNVSEFIKKLKGKC